MLTTQGAQPPLPQPETVPAQQIGRKRTIGQIAGHGENSAAKRKKIN